MSPVVSTLRIALAPIRPVIVPFTVICSAPGAGGKAVAAAARAVFRGVEAFSGQVLAVELWNCVIAARTV